MHERPLTMDELPSLSAKGRLLEVFGVCKIGFSGKDLVLPDCPGGLGSVGKDFWQRLWDIQEGKVEWKGWRVPCL